MSQLMRRMIFFLATNGEESDKRGADDTEMGNEVLSAVAHCVMVHYAKKELIKKRKKEIQAQRWAIHSGCWSQEIRK
jgi:hypothetical protein